MRKWFRNNVRGGHKTPSTSGTPPAPPTSSDQQLNSNSITSSSQPSVLPAIGSKVNAQSEPTSAVSPSPPPQSNPTANATPLPPGNTKSAWSVAWNALETSLRVLEKNSDAFPPLKSAVGALITCIDLVQAAAANREDYESLAVELKAMTEVLQQYAPRLTQSGNVARILQSVEAEVAHIERQRDHNWARRFIESSQDKDDVIMRYKKIQSLFRQLQTDIAIRTWDNSRKLVEDALLAKLSPVHDAQFNSVFSATIKRRGCTAKTRREIQQALHDWGTATDSAKVCWMNGMAGTGKSTIAYSFCETLEHNRRLSGNFYCSRLSTSCNKASSIVPTLAYQFAHYSLAFRAALCNILDEYPDVSKRNIPWQFQKLIEEPMEVVKASMEEDVLVVIDALDECMDTATVGLFLDTVLHLATDLPIKFFITSRPEPIIQNRFIYGPDSKRVRLHDVEASIVAGDIKEYLNEALTAMQPPPTPSQIKQLADRCGKLFIYAATAVRYILPDKGSVDSTKRMQTLLSPAPTKSTKQYAELNVLYSGILSAALKNEELEQEEIDNMNLVLRTAISAKEPISISIIAALLALSEREVSLSLEPLGSVLHVQESDGLVSALHASFPDYMLDKSRSEEFYCDGAVHDELLAHGCFDVMTAQLRFNICGLESSAFFDEDVPDSVERIGTAISPALWYSCRYWGEHLQEAPNTAAARSGLVDFLATRLLFWMEVLNLKKVIVMGGEILQRLSNSKWLIESPTDTRNLLEDAISFVDLYFTGTCRRSTPHIYISALPMCRKTSSVYTNYWPRMHGLLDVGDMVMEDRVEHPPLVWWTASAIYSLAVSCDGTRIASGSNDLSIKVWDAQTGEYVAGPFTNHVETVHSLSFSPDGTKLISGSDAIRILDVQTGKYEVFARHDSTVRSVAFSPDGTRIVSGSYDKTIRVWSTRTGECVVGPFVGHEDQVLAVRFSPDGTQIVSGSRDRSIRIWNAGTGECVAGPFTGHDNMVRSVAFSPDSSRIASCSDDYTVRVWDAQTGESTPFIGHDGPVLSISFSSDGTKIASCSIDRTVRVWDARTGKIAAGPFTGHEDLVHSVAFFPDGTRVASGSFDGTIRVCLVSSDESVFEQGKTVASVAFSPDGNQIVSGSYDRTIRVWDAQTGACVVGPFVGHGDHVLAVRFSADGTRIVSGSRDRSIRVWDTRTGESVAEPFIGHSGPITSIALSGDGTQIVSGSEDKTIRLWHASTGEASEPFVGHDGIVRCVALSFDGTQIASGSEDETIRLWKVQTGERVAQLPGHGEVNCIAFSPDDTSIVYGTDYGVMEVLDARTGETTTQPFQNGRSVRSVDFSPDGTRIVSGADDKAIRVWDALTGVCIAGPFVGHGGWVLSVAFSPDATRIVSGSADHTIRVWDLTSRIGALRHSIAPAFPDDVRLSDDKVAFTPDGWLFYMGQPFFWVPPNYLSRFPYPHNSLVIGLKGKIPSIDYQNLFIGKTWSHCYIRDTIL